MQPANNEVCWFAGIAGSLSRVHGGASGIRSPRALAKRVHGGVPFSKSARRGHKMAICEGLHIANLSLKNPTWENDRERMPVCPKAPIRTHISTLFVHDLPLGLNLLFGTKARRSRAKPMSRSQKVNRHSSTPRAVKKALADLKVSRRASLLAWRECRRECDRRACASRPPSATRRGAPDRSIPPLHS